MLAECNWLIPGDTKCWVKRPAHRFLVKESGNMVLEIPKVTTEDTGRYVCQQMSKSHRSDLTPKPCFLFVNGEGGGGQRERGEGGGGEKRRRKKTERKRPDRRTETCRDRQTE